MSESPAILSKKGPKTAFLPFSKCAGCDFAASRRTFKARGVAGARSSGSRPKHQAAIVVYDLFVYTTRVLCLSLFYFGVVCFFMDICVVPSCCVFVSVVKCNSVSDGASESQGYAEEEALCVNSTEKSRVGRAYGEGRE